MKLLLGFVCMMVLLAAPARADGRAATITMSRGAVSLYQTGRSVATPAAKGTVLFRGDEIETGKDGAVTVTTADGGVITMGAGGTIVIDDYLFDPAAPARNKARFKLLHAAFSYVGGKMDAMKGADVRMDLDFGSIGIRGTKLIRGMKDMECWIYLEDGAITVFNDGGTVTLAPGQGTRMKAKTAAPLAPEGWTDEQVAWIRAALPQ
jgi:hypothetical protein